jgi:hypothetical protein
MSSHSICVAIGSFTFASSMVGMSTSSSSTTCLSNTFAHFTSRWIMGGSRECMNASPERHKENTHTHTYMSELNKQPNHCDVPLTNAQPSTHTCYTLPTTNYQLHTTHHTLYTTRYTTWPTLRTLHHDEYPLHTTHYPLHTTHYTLHKLAHLSQPAPG